MKCKKQPNYAQTSKLYAVDRIVTLLLDYTNYIGLY